MFAAGMSFNETAPSSSSSQRTTSPVKERRPSSGSNGPTLWLVSERAPSSGSNGHTRSPSGAYRQAYEMIPYALQTGLRPLVLVRKSISAYSRRSRRRVIRLVMSRRAWEDQAATRDDKSVASSSSSSSTSGICWKRAHHGSDVLQKSLAESNASDADSQAFSRQLYLESLTNLIQGLPPDLTDQETLLLRNALTESSKLSDFDETNQPRTRNPSLLHRSLASVIVAICLLVRLALPYIKLFLAAVYSYDRAYHIRERIFALSITTADSFGRTNVALANTAMTNQVFLRAVTYWVDGIRGGLNEGLDQGLKVIENEDGP